MSTEWARRGIYAPLQQLVIDRQGDSISRLCTNERGAIAGFKGTRDLQINPFKKASQKNLEQGIMASGKESPASRIMERARGLGDQDPGADQGQGQGKIKGNIWSFAQKKVEEFEPFVQNQQRRDAWGS
eukprot:1141787-Pelagomonas_calceolata.AAC.2